MVQIVAKIVPLRLLDRDVFLLVCRLYFSGFPVLEPGDVRLVLLLQKNLERLGKIGMIGVDTMVPVVERVVPWRQTSVQSGQLLIEPVGLPVLKLRIERDPDVGKLGCRSILIRVQQLRYFEVVAVLDMQN